MKLINMIMFFSMIISLMLIKMNHPLNIGLMLFMQSMFIPLMMGMMFQTFWMSYILFMIFSSGLMILFMYMISLISNKKMLNYKLNFNNLIIMLILLIFMYYYKFYLFKSLDSYYMNNVYMLMDENYLILIKLFNKPNNLINMIIMLYLFYLMIITVKITNYSMGPLRMKF